MIPVRQDTHCDLGWSRAVGFGFARSVTTVAVATSEIPRVAQVMPVVFRKRDNRWETVAIMGLADGSNAYVSGAGRWRAAFVPALLRVYPFCIDDLGALSVWDGFSPDEPTKKGVEPFFENGTLTTRLSETQHFLGVVAAGIASACPVLESLDAAGVLVPWHCPGIEVASARDDLFALDALRLQALDDKAVLAHFRAGALRWLHAHIDSLHHSETLQTLASDVADPGLAAPRRPEKIDDAADLLAAISADLGDAEV